MKILIKAIAGSHLFGTQTPESDTDYKGIYIPTQDEILLGNYSETRQFSTGNSDSKNGKEDEDIEFYSLKKFFKMIRNGDTAAIELLFTPENMIIEKDPIWDEIMEYRDQLLSKKVTGIIGYARHQANKFGTKGQRLGELGKAIDILKDIEKELDFANPKMKHKWCDIVAAFKGFEHIEIITLSATAPHLPEIPAINILGKKFDYHCGFEYVQRSLKKTFKEYGQRAREAKKNGGVDWKALSHAARVSVQGLELLETGKISLPLVGIYGKIVKGIKLGEWTPIRTSDFIEDRLIELEKAKENSILQDEVSQEFTNELLLKFYKRMF